MFSLGVAEASYLLNDMATVRNRQDQVKDIQFNNFIPDLAGHIQQVHLTLMSI